MWEQNEIRILIADDHAIVRETLSRLLSFEPDLRVVGQVDHGCEVVEAVGRYDPDILLLDVNMPGASGLAILKELQTANTRTRVILFTGSDNQEEFARALEFGACSIVQKQLATAILVDCIRTVHHDAAGKPSLAEGSAVTTH